MLKRSLLQKISVLILCFAAFQGCNKETIRTNPVKNAVSANWSGSDTVVLIGDWLAFKDKYVFENTIEYLGTLEENDVYQWLDDRNFNSMLNEYDDRDSIDSTRIMPIKDPMLAAVLNPDGMVQIGDSAYKVNIDQQLVYVLKNVTTNNMELLRNEEVSSSYIDTFPTYVEVLHLDTYDEEDFVRSKGGCGEKAAKGDKHAKMPGYEGEEHDYRIDMKEVYQEAGIYFSLMTEAKHQRTTASGVFVKRVPTTMIYGYEVSWKKRCKNEQLGYTYRGLNQTQEVMTDKINDRFYHSSHALSLYMLRVVYEWKQVTDYAWKEQDLGKIEDTDAYN